MLSRLAVSRVAVARPVMAVARSGVRTFKVTPKPRAAEGNPLLNADNSSTTKLYHITSMAGLALAPAAVIAAPSGLSFPVDLTMGVLFPLHAHIGMNYIISDYVPKFFGRGALGPARVVWFGVTSVTFIGLAMLNLTGPGISMTIKSLWKEPAKKE